MFNLTESEIMANWSADESVRVSVCCITYKQEKYIKQAIDSFLMQKTTFPFEIIIGEDCGGDGTLAILAAYQARYPKIINIITSKNNIGANANLLRIFNVAQGDYISVCEGDDYWCDENKLQIQFEHMERYHACSFLVHPAYCETNGEKIKTTWPCQSNQNIESVLSVRGQFSPTSAYFFRKSVVEYLPEWFFDAPIGDYYIEAIASSLGQCNCIDKYMSVYRMSAINSWTSNLKNDNSGILIVNTFKKHVEYLNKLICLLPNHGGSIKSKIYQAELICAITYLNNKNYICFKQHMNKTNVIACGSVYHKTLYIFRGSKLIVFLLYRIKCLLQVILKRFN